MGCLAGTGSAGGLGGCQGVGGQVPRHVVEGNPAIDSLISPCDRAGPPWLKPAGRGSKSQATGRGLGFQAAGRGLGFQAAGRGLGFQAGSGCMAGSSGWAPEGACSQDIASCGKQLLLLLIWQSSQAGCAQQEHWGPVVLPCWHDCCSPVQ